MMQAGATPNEYRASQLYIVGAEDYVARVIKRRLFDLGIGVSGHAPPSWRPPFAPPRHTTHLLVAEDDCGPALKDHARHLSKELHLPLIEGPARNHWSEVEELLNKEGLVERGSPPVAPPPVEVAAQPLTTNLGAVMAEHAAAAATPRPKDVAIRLLKESGGRLTDKLISAIVEKETGKEYEVGLVTAVRKEGSYGKPAIGKRPEDLVALLVKYGMGDGHGARVPGKEKVMRVPRKNGVAKPTPTAAVDDEALRAQLVAMVTALHEKIVVKFGITSLALRYADGKWADPEIERVSITRPTIALGFAHGATK